MAGIDDADFSGVLAKKKNNHGRYIRVPCGLTPFASAGTLCRALGVQRCRPLSAHGRVPARLSSPHLAPEAHACGRFEDPWKQKVFCWIREGKFFLCAAGPDKKPINVGQRDTYDLLDWVAMPDKDGKFTLASDTTSSNDALKLKADNARDGQSWIDAIREAANEAKRKLEEGRMAALENERKQVEKERRARLEAEAAAKKAAEQAEQVATPRSVDRADGGDVKDNPEDKKRLEHAQKMISKLTEEASSHKERLKNLEQRVAQIVEAPGEGLSLLQRGKVRRPRGG